MLILSHNKGEVDVSMRKYITIEKIMLGGKKLNKSALIDFALSNYASNEIFSISVVHLSNPNLKPHKLYDNLYIY